MAVDLQQAAWLKSQSLGALVVPASGVAWGASRAVALEYTSPIDAVADANTEAARTIALLAGPNVKDNVTIPGRRRDLLFKCVSIVSANLGYDQIPELVINGDGSSGANWVNPGGGNAALVASVGGRLRVTKNDAGGANGLVYQGVSTPIGRNYRFRATRYAGSGGAWISISSAPAGGTSYFSANGGDGVLSDVTFAPITATTYVNLIVLDAINGHYAEFDDISIKEIGRRVFVIGVTENANNTTTLTVIRSLV
jgi:hypothetical protein